MPTRDMPDRIVTAEEIEANQALENMAKLRVQAETQRRLDGHRIATLARELRLTYDTLQHTQWELVAAVGLSMVLLVANILLYLSKKGVI